MRIVVLDGYTLNPGDLSWAGLEKLGRCEIHDRTPADQILKRAAGAEILFVNKISLSRGILAKLDSLRYVGVLATGYNIVDIAAAKERNVVVTNIPTYGTRSVAQMVFAHVLNFTQHIAHHSETVRQGRWTKSPDFCYWDYPLIELDGLTLGIVGFGRIGRATAEVGRALGMNVLAYDSLPIQSVPEGMRVAGLEEVFRLSDVVSLHCPLTPETRNIVNAQRLALMKPSAFLINTSRGSLVDETALAEALNSGKIAGAGLDVLAVEPPPADHPLFKAKNCQITPHIAWATKSARKRLLDEAVDNLRAFLAGKPKNVVN